MSTLDIHAIASLPSQEQRFQALAQTGLVRQLEDNEYWDGLAIHSGEFRPAGPFGWQPPFPFELLTTSDYKELAAEAWQVAFGQNRLILQGDLSKCLQFLESHDTYVKHVKRLDIQFDHDSHLENWESRRARNDWQQLSEFISRKFSLKELDLSLDAGVTYETYMEGDLHEANGTLDFLPDRYLDIVNILSESLNGRKPKQFSIFWVAYFDLESAGEKQIMGQDYDSIALGKIPHTRRSDYFPHGGPGKENPRGLQL